MVHGISDERVEPAFIAALKARQAPYITTTSLSESLADIPGFVYAQAAFDLTGTMTPARVARLTDPKFVDLLRTSLGENSGESARAALPRIRDNLRTLYAAGVLVVSGTDTPFPGLQPGLASQIELSLTVKAGLKPIDALRTATINAQRMIGRQKELGSIEVGKLADMIILDRDPLADIGNIRFIYRIIKGGCLYEPSEILGTNRAK